MAAPKAGDLLGGRVRLEQRLGSGGFSSVWRATDVGTDTPVAVKLLHADLARVPSVVQRFQQEAEILQQLRHPSIARGFADGTQGERPFITLEYVRGESMQDRLRSCSSAGRLMALSEIEWICGHVASALVDAHRHGVVHRDLKPANVMVNDPYTKPFVKVLDFGAAKALDGRLDPTTVGRVIGSIPYLAPEQLRQQRVDGRTDQFALAVFVYEVTTLRRAWGLGADGAPLAFHFPLGDHNTQLDVMRRILQGQRPRLSDVRSDVPTAVDDVVARALSIRPEDRFGTVQAFMGALRAALHERPMPDSAGLEVGHGSLDIEDTKPILTLRALLDEGPETLEDDPEAETVREPSRSGGAADRGRIPAAETEARDLELTLDE